MTDSPLIVDAGAHTGHTVDLLLGQYARPTIHAFEPNPETAAQLRAKYGKNKRVVVHELALGSESGLALLNILRRPSSSSLLLPTDLNYHYHEDEMDLVKTCRVRRARLDSLFDEEIDLLKMDLQGYELEALKGSEQLLSKIKCITIEVEFVPLYANQPLFADVDLFLRSRGFRLFNLYELWTHPDGQLTAGDALYLNDRFFGGPQGKLLAEMS